MDIFSVLNMLGGLALFLYGMNAMGDGLAKVSGGRLESVLEKLTKKRIMAVLLGAAVTAVIQSSSATTVMVVGFVNSGIMKLGQAIGIIMGANIGTTITSWILALTGIQSDNIFVSLLKPSSFSPILAVIGASFILFSKKDRKRDIGTILVGFAILMFGMETMSAAVKPLADVPAVHQYVHHVHQPCARHDCRSGADSGNPELIGFRRYIAGTLCNRRCHDGVGNSYYNGSEYRYLRDVTHICDGSEQECETCGACTLLF